MLEKNDMVVRISYTAWDGLWLIMAEWLHAWQFFFFSLFLKDAATFIQ